MTDFPKISSRFIEVDPKDLLLIEKNARFMRHETYQQLVDNIRRDGTMTQTPFCWLNRERGGYEVLSGNHRIKAAIEAGLDLVTIQVTDDELSEDHRLAIQLSHNAISGEDDPSVLKELYDSIGDIDHRLYAGLDDNTLELLADINPETLSEAALKFATLSFLMLPSEITEMREIWDKAKHFVSGSDAPWLASYDDFEAFVGHLDEVAAAYGIQNMATALRIVTELLDAHLDDLADGFTGRDVDMGDWVPLTAVFGTNRIPAPVAKKVRSMVEQAKANGSIEHPWEILTVDG